MVELDEDTRLRPDLMVMVGYGKNKQCNPTPTLVGSYGFNRTRHHTPPRVHGGYLESGHLTTKITNRKILLIILCREFLTDSSMIIGIIVLWTLHRARLCAIGRQLEIGKYVEIDSEVYTCEGVLPIRTREGGRECTLMASLERVLGYHGETYDYVDIMGLSGAAFRVRYAVPTEMWLCGGRVHPGISADPCVGPHLTALSRATGYTWEFDLWHDHGGEGYDHAARRLMEEIRASRPVVALNLHGGSVWGVVAGYREGTLTHDAAAVEDGKWTGEGLLCRTYYDEPQVVHYKSTPRFPWNVYYIKKTHDPLDGDEAIENSLHLAAELMTTERAEVKGPTGWFWHYRREYANGQAAYDAWIADLADEVGIAALPADQTLMYWQSQAFLFEQLRDARYAAARYLRRVAQRMQGASAPSAQHPASSVNSGWTDRAIHILEATVTAEEMVQLMTEKWQTFPYCNTGYQHGAGWNIRPKGERLPGPNTPPYAAQWTPEARLQACQLLEKLKALDAKLAAAITRAAN